MKHLFVIRHGDYHTHGDSKGSLTPKGESQIEALAREMQALLGDEYSGHYLLSSTAPRAEQTAAIIARFFGLGPFDTQRSLWTGGGEDLYWDELRGIDALLAPHEGNDVVTITTHYEVVGSYPRHVARTRLDRDERIDRPGKGQGVYFDLEQRTYKRIGRRE